MFVTDPVITGKDLHLLVNRDEMTTIVYGLMAYRDKLETTLNEAAGTDSEYEDQAFAYGVLADIARLLFGILEDHTPAKKDRIRDFLDIV